MWKAMVLKLSLLIFEMKRHVQVHMHVVPSVRLLQAFQQWFYLVFGEFKANYRQVSELPRKLDPAYVILKGKEGVKDKW